MVSRNVREEEVRVRLIFYMNIPIATTLMLKFFQKAESKKNEIEILKTDGSYFETSVNPYGLKIGKIVQ